MQVPLNETQIGALDGSGDGTVQLGPGVPGVYWQPTQVSISMTGSIPAGPSPSTCTLAVGGTVPSAQFLDETYQVTGATSGAISGQVIQVGQSVFATWANGNPNATVTITVTGTMTIPG